MKAIIVEDDKLMSSVLRDWLEKLGFEVLAAYRMDEALKIFLENPNAELITLDMNLPDSFHEETLLRIREIRERNPNSLFFVLTGVLGPVYEKKVIELGADAFMEKLDVPTEKSFGQKLKDVLSSLFSRPTEYQRNLPLVEALAKKVSQRCTELGCSIGVHAETEKELPKSTSNGITSL